MKLKCHSNHTLGLCGRLVALWLTVACAGCAASCGSRCGDGCGIRTGGCTQQHAGDCTDGVCEPAVWRAGYRWTNWRPLVAECDRVDAACVDAAFVDAAFVDAAFVEPTAPLPMSDEEIPMPPAADFPVPGEAPPADEGSSASVDWEPLLPQTTPVVRATGPPLVPQQLPGQPATIWPKPNEARPTILPATIEAIDDPFDAEVYSNPHGSASTSAVYAPLAWVPTAHRELQFRELPAAP